MDPGAGRRSTGFRTSDVHDPAAQLNGHAWVQSMDAPIGEGEHGDEILTLHDAFASNADDPATIAARRLNWAAVLDSLDRTKQAILIALAEGTELTLLVRRSRSSLQMDKVRLGRMIQARLGQDILIQAQTRPGWKDALAAIRERLTCRAQRRAA
jgi:hypothetical protein